MKLSHCLSVGSLLMFTSFTLADEPKVLAKGLKNPHTMVVTPEGIFVLEVGDPFKQGDRRIIKIHDEKQTQLPCHLNNPIALAAYQKWLYVADIDGLWRIDSNGNKKLHANLKLNFQKVSTLTSMVADPENGMLYLIDYELHKIDENNHGIFESKVYRVTPKGVVSMVADLSDLPGPFGGIVMDGTSHLLVSNFGIDKGGLWRIKLADGFVTQVSSEKKLHATDLFWDQHGRLWCFDSSANKIQAIPKPGDKSIDIVVNIKADAITLNAIGNALLIVQADGALTEVPLIIPTKEVDQSPLPIHTEVAFPKIQFEGWNAETDEGKPNPLRPIFFTHDNTNKEINYLATEQGVIYRFKNDPEVKEGKIFLDLSKKVKYDDRRNEEGLLGLAFHPKFKENGEFFVFYTVVEPDLTNIVSRFRVMKDDPTKADPASEEVLLTYKKPYWNHDGGTLLFGPDGYLYVVHGDGGLANDPHDNAQNPKSLLGKILRIDVDHKGKDTPYAIPKDNPFVENAEFRPEIWAWGLRNPWRMSFDRKTGQLWAGDVGQNLYEEIDLIEKGKNYGWNRREGFHPFGAKGSGVDPKYTDPIWEYSHDVGKSITGGVVYHGQAIPELEGYYVYADYVASKLWALKYDPKQKRVVENRPLISPGRAIMSFGEDANGEVYLLTLSGNGSDGILKYAK